MAVIRPPPNAKGAATNVFYRWTVCDHQSDNIAQGASYIGDYKKIVLQLFISICGFC